MNDSTEQWCGPTGELSTNVLRGLIDRSRRATGPAKKPTGGNAPLNDPWFEDSGPIADPGTDPSKPVEIEEQRERKERTSIPKVVVKPVYPVYRGGGSRVVRVLLGVSVIGAAIATLGVLY